MDGGNVCLLFIYFIPSSLYLLIPYPYLAPSPTALSFLVSLFSISVSMFLLCFMHSFFFFLEIPYIRDIIQYLSFSVWFISLSIISSRFTYIAENGRISFFVMAIIPFPIFTTSSLFICLLMDSWIPSICWLLWTTLLWMLRCMYLFKLVFSFFLFLINYKKQNC